MDGSALSAAGDEVPSSGHSGKDHLHIGQVAARTELSLRTIRHYDDVGLVRPSARSQGGFRLYTEADVARLMVIRRMKPLGFTLDEMGELLSITDLLDAGDTAGLKAAERERLLLRLGRFEQATRERCETLRTQLSRAEEFAADLRRRAGQLTTDTP
ncbi:MerR family transcriptional regulator [Sphaerisporangium siamense]|uniref:DNA-binding transcriptional MerR regulator n=1 Tax=Sphaerisporangium siamense TaxID=795645 RepID=A0A7W7D358_9ACTN|nr:MerR family transcriptional regulator [Sphaerisporangium siamense]MBB4699422.1 DNA-binding transcriptional MerR regulator [Sphaerisporangium siamense]GII86833.1 MerR family transcriptional regulator [Sphaerisporangium siamense]